MTRLYINNTNLVDGANAKLASLDDGSMLVVWAQEQDNKTSAIVAGRYYEYGGVEYNITYISDNTLNVNCSNPLIATFSDNTYSITWLSKNETSCEILTQSFYIDATTLSDIQTLAYISDNSCPTNFISDAVSDVDNNKAVFVAWSNNENMTINGFNINSSTELYSPISECNLALNATSANILALNFDVAVLAWISQSSHQAYVQKFNITSCNNITDSTLVSSGLSGSVVSFMDSSKFVNSSSIVMAWFEASLRPTISKNLYVQRLYSNLSSIESTAIIWSSPFNDVSMPPAIAVDDDDSFEVTWSYGLAEATENSTENAIDNRIMVQSFASNGTALNQTEIGEDDNDMFPPEIVAFEDGAYGIMWTISSLASSNAGYLQQAPEGDQLIVEIVPAPPISCPASISFGPSAQLSPTGLVVRKSDVSYFNGNGYVAIWNTVDTTNPKAITTTITAQLFDDNNGQVPGQTYSVTTTNQRIGKTIVSVFEDRSFVIAYSTQARTGANWQINVQYYQYQDATSTSVQKYTTTSASQVTIQSSKHNNGRFDLDTLVLSNEFIIATMQDKYNMLIARYSYSTNDQTGQVTCSKTYQNTNNVKSSDSMEMIVRAVPTQNFFTVIWSRLSKESDGKGISLQSYLMPAPPTPAPTPAPLVTTLAPGEIPVPTPVTPVPTPAPTEAPKPMPGSILAVTSNPRSMQADLSYGGTITVVWHEASTDCRNQQILSYQAQMFTGVDNTITQLSQIIQVTNAQNNQSSNVPSTTPVPTSTTASSGGSSQGVSLGEWSWLHQVISYENSFVVTFIDQELSPNQLMTVAIINQDGTVATQLNQRLGQATNAPTAPPPTTAEPTPSPITDTPVPQSQYRTFQELTGSDELGSGNAPPPTPAITMPPIPPKVTCSCCFPSRASAYLEDGEVAIPAVDSNVPNKYELIDSKIWGTDGELFVKSASKKINLEKVTRLKLFIENINNNAMFIYPKPIDNSMCSSDFKTCTYDDLYEEGGHNLNIFTKTSSLVNTFIVKAKNVINMNHVVPFFLFKMIPPLYFRFDCSFLGSSYSYVNSKEIYLCKKFENNPYLPNTNENVYNTVLGRVVRSIFSVSFNQKNTAKTYDSCVLDVEEGFAFTKLTDEGLQNHPSPACVQYLTEAVFSMQQCQDISFSNIKYKICNFTDSQNGGDIEAFYKPLMDTIKSLAGESSVPENLSKLYTNILGPIETTPWSVISMWLGKMYYIMQAVKLEIIYMPSSLTCSDTTTTTTRTVTLAYAYRLYGIAINICEPYIELPIYPIVSDSGMNSKFRTIAHELSHLVGAYDFEANNVPIYKIAGCKVWASSHPKLTSDSRMIADCLSFIIAQQYALKLNDTDDSTLNIEDSMPRTRRTDMSFEVKTISEERVVTMIISLTNNSPNDYLIAQELMFLGPARVVPTAIVGPSRINCYDIGYSTHEDIERVLIPFLHGEKLTSTIMLSDICSFKYALPGIYTVNFNSYFDLYSESTDLGDADEFSWLVGNSSFLIGETRDATVSESLSHADSL